MTRRRFESGSGCRSIRPVFVAALLLLGCTAGEGGLFDAPQTGLRVKMTHHDDDGGRIAPSVGEPVLVFRADAPGMSELLEWGPRGTTERHPQVVPAVFVSPPQARATTNRKGIAEFELSAGDYVVTTPDSVLYESISVVDGRWTECSRSSGFRFVTWNCQPPE